MCTHTYTEINTHTYTTLYAHLHTMTIHYTHTRKSVLTPTHKHAHLHTPSFTHTHQEYTLHAHTPICTQRWFKFTIMLLCTSKTQWSVRKGSSINSSSTPTLQQFIHPCPATVHPLLPCNSSSTPAQ